MSVHRLIEVVKAQGQPDRVENDLAAIEAYQTSLNALHLSTSTNRDVLAAQNAQHEPLKQAVRQLATEYRVDLSPDL